jgi:hypothetical protein
VLPLLLLPLLGPLPTLRRAHCRHVHGTLEARPCVGMQFWDAFCNPLRSLHANTLLQISRPKIPAPMFRAIGFLVTAAASAEFTLATQILRLIAPNRSVFHAYPLVAGVEAKVKITLIRIFLKMFNLDEDGKLNKLLDKLTSLFDRRNEVAHSVVQANPKKKGQIRFQDLRAKVRLGEMPPSQVRTAKEISGYARQMLLHCRRWKIN